MKIKLLPIFITLSVLFHFLLILIPINYTDSIKFEKKIEPIEISISNEQSEVVARRAENPMRQVQQKRLLRFARNDEVARNAERDSRWSLYSAKAGYGNDKGTLADYKLILESRIYKYLYIPNSLKNKKLDLASLVEIDLKHDGSLIGINLIKPSGNELIDNLVISAIKDASPFPALPPDFGDKNLKVALPLRFRVNSNL